jgi:nitrogen fixation NifU-like protein
MSQFDELYQEIILDHYKKPRNKAPLDDADVVVHENPTCGDSIKICVTVDSDKLVKEVLFDGHGCAISMASASMMTEHVAGKELKIALDEIYTFIKVLRGEVDTSILEEWGDLNALSGIVAFPVRVKCASLAWHALAQELENNKNMR